eukprot:1222518-Pyramimonas_sp.AAC.1
MVTGNVRRTRGMVMLMSEMMRRMRRMMRSGRRMGMMRRMRRMRRVQATVRMCMIITVQSYYHPT